MKSTKADSQGRLIKDFDPECAANSIETLTNCPSKAPSGSYLLFYSKNYLNYEDKLREFYGEETFSSKTVFEDSTHYVQKDKPAEVAEQILKFISI